MNVSMKQIGLAALLTCVNVVAAEQLVNWNLDGLSRSGTTATHAEPSDVHPSVESSDLALGFLEVTALQNVVGPVEFRIYAVLASGVGNRMGYGHIFYQDGQADLRVMGTVE